jgi:hypothetical protein
MEDNFIFLKIHLRELIGYIKLSEELLVKQLKNCERNMQEHSDSIRRPSMIIVGIEEGEEV